MAAQESSEIFRAYIFMGYFPSGPAFCHRLLVESHQSAKIDVVGGSDYETSFSPITPDRMRAMQRVLIGAADSPSNTIPRMAVPAAPMPVQTA